MSEWPTALVGRYVRQRVDKVAITAGADYDTMGVRWYGYGAYLRPPSRPQTKTLNRAAAGDFVFCRIDVQNGPFAVVPASLDGALVTNEFPLYTVEADFLNAEFIALCFSSQRTRDRIGRLRDGRDGRARWKEADFEAWQIPLPPVSAQTKIVEAVAAVDEAIRATAAESMRLAAILKIRRAALANNDTFAAVSADKAFDIRLGRQRSPQRATGPSMTPYLRSANVGYDELRLDDVMSMDFDERERERYRLENGDVLVSEGSAGPEAVGMPAAWHDEIDGPVCFQNTLLRYRAIEGVTTPEFVRHWCLWAYESGTFRDMTPASVNIKHIGDRRAKAMPVRLPNIDEQNAIVAELEPMVEVVASLRHEAARLRVARAALLDALLTRKIEVSI
jgi:type I restriction enzyme S subunit